MLAKVVLVQCDVGRRLTMEETLLIFRQRPDFVILPEYFNADPARPEAGHNALVAPQRLAYCRTLSEHLETTLIAGTAVEADGTGYHNTAYVYDQGSLVGSYRKVHPTTGETRRGIIPGVAPAVFSLYGTTIAILICADVLHPENFQRLQPYHPDIVFVPAVSPGRSHETVREKFTRDQLLFVDGARAAGSYVVKCCAIGDLWGGRLQGRSLITAPWGILTRISPDEEEKVRFLSFVLDLAELRDFRRRNGKTSAI